MVPVIPHLLHSVDHNLKQTIFAMICRLIIVSIDTIVLRYHYRKFAIKGRLDKIGVECQRQNTRKEISVSHFGNCRHIANANSHFDKKGKRMKNVSGS